MKVLVTGAAGQLGHDVINELAGRSNFGCGEFLCTASDMAPEYSGIKDGSAVTAAPYVPLDITDAAAVENIIVTLKPDAVIHCAAWTAVDLAEEEANHEKVRLVNSVGTQNIVNAIKKLITLNNCCCKMMYISTDYVFNGEGTAPWKADCRDYAPLSIYGKSKLAGELAVADNLDDYFIVRTAWAFGRNGSNFIKTMLNLARKYERINVVNDQIGTPTYTLDLARLLCDMIVTDKYGYYHATNSEVSSYDLDEISNGYTSDGTRLGYISWYDFAKEIFRQAAALGHAEYSEDRVTVVPVTTEEYGISKAARPFNSRLEKSKLEENGFVPLPAWKDAVRRYLMAAGFPTA